LLEEVSLLIIRPGGEALLLCLVNSCPDGHLLGLLVSNGLVLLSARLSPGLASQLSAELGIVASAVVEVNGVRCSDAKSVNQDDIVFIGTGYRPSAPVARVATAAVAIVTVREAMVVFIVLGSPRL